MMYRTGATKRHAGALASLLAALVCFSLAADLAAQDQPELVAARHILIGYEGAARSQATRTKEEAETLAKELVAKLQADPVAFGATAAEMSDGPSGPKGGLLGNPRPGQPLAAFPPSDMVPPFSAAVLAAAEGEIVGPVETDFGFHIIQRLALDTQPKPYAVIIVAYGETAENLGLGARTKEAAQAIAEEATAAVAGGMIFTDAAQKYSDAPSKALGGYQGELIYGAAFPPGPLDAAMSLEPGEMSEPMDADRAIFVVHHLTEAEHAAIEAILDEEVVLRGIFLRHQDALNAGEDDVRTLDEARAVAADIVAKTAAGESFEDFAVQFNESEMLKDRKGLLGAMKRRVLPPDVADLAFGLAVGQAGSIETPEGIVVLQRIAPEEAEAPEDTEAEEAAPAEEATETEAESAEHSEDSDAEGEHADGDSDESHADDSDTHSHADGEHSHEDDEHAESGEEHSHEHAESEDSEETEDSTP